MQRWKPKRTAGLWIGLAVLIIVLIGAVFLAVRLTIAFIQPPEQWQVDLFLYGEMVGALALLMVTGFVAYRTATVLTMSYEIDRNGLYIFWLGNRTVIPIERIEMVDNGDPDTLMPWQLFQGIGCYWGEGRTSDLKPLHMYSTLPPHQSLLLHTANACYAISPADQEGFVQDLEQRRRIGVVKPLTTGQEHGRILFYAFWNDQVVRWALLLALLLNLLVLGILAARYPYLSPSVEMRFNAIGEAVEMRPRHQVLFLPLATIGLGLLNAALGLAIYRWERTGARMLQITSVVLPILFGVAIFTILAR